MECHNIAIEVTLFEEPFEFQLLITPLQLGSGLFCLWVGPFVCFFLLEVLPGMISQERVVECLKALSGRLSGSGSQQGLM